MKNTVKRSLAVLLLFAMVLALAACGNSGNDTPYIPPAGGSDQSGNSANADDAVAYAAFKTDATLAETVLYEDNGVTVTAMGITYDEGYATLDVQVLNNSDVERNVECSQISINGLMVEGFETWFLAPGDGSTMGIYCCWYDEMTRSGVSEIAVIEMNVSVYDEYYECLAQQLCRMETSAAANFVYDDGAYLRAVSSKEAQQDQGYTVLHQVTEPVALNENVTILSQTLTDIGDGVPALFLEMVNNGTDWVRVGAHDVAMNAVRIDGNGAYSGSGELRPGTKRILEVRVEETTGLMETFEMAEIAMLEVTAFVQDSSNDEITAEVPLSYTVPDRVAEVNTGGTKLYDENGLWFAYKDIYAPNYNGVYYYGYNLYFVAVNNSDQTLRIDCDLAEMLVNGISVDHYCSGVTLEPGQTGAVIAWFVPETLDGTTVITEPDQISSVQFSMQLTDAADNQIGTIPISLTF